METARILYHAARRTDRASIEEHGLLGIHVPGGPRRPKWAITGQPAGLYLAASIDGARRYIAHHQDRFAPWWRSANPLVRTENIARLTRIGGEFAQLDWDIWEVTLRDEELLADTDWIEEAYCVQADIPPARIRRVAEWKFAAEGKRAASRD